MLYDSICSENGLESNESEGLHFIPSNVLQRSKINFDSPTGSCLLSKSIPAFRTGNLMLIYQTVYFIDYEKL